MTTRKGILWTMALASLAVGAGLCLLTKRQMLGLFALPFAPLAAGLRRLSLLGGLWDVLAWALYAGVSSLPVLYLLWRVAKKRGRPWDALLAVLSALLFWALYWMINPSAIGDFFGRMAGVSHPLMGACLWAAVLCYGILRLCARMERQSTDGLCRWLSVLVWCLIAACFLDVFARCLPAAIRSLSAGTGGAFLTLLTRAVTGMMAVRTGLYGLELIGQLSGGWYTDQTVRAARALGEACREAITVTAVAQLCHTLLQVLLSSGGGDLELTLNLPVGQLLALLSVMLLSRMLVRGAQLQDDSDSII